MKKHIGITLLSLLLCFPLMAEVKYSRMTSNYSQESLYINVKDSLSKASLPEAAVMIVSGEDTTKCLTGLDGNVKVLNNFNKGDIEIIASYVGFKTVKARLDILFNVPYSIQVEMVQDPEMLSSVIITADAVAMVIKGDTTVFNSAAFSKKQGDYLKDLIKKMPGVDIQNDNITFNGEKIDRVMVNGTNLFGKNIKDAMSMLLAEEVKSVKVYDTQVEKSPDTIVEKKEKVMDVITWNPLSHISQLKTSAAAGVYYNNSSQTGWAADLSAANYSTSEKPNISINLSAADNINNYPNYNSATSPFKTYTGNLSFSKRTKRSTFNGGLKFNHLASTNSSSSYKDYYPSEMWGERQDSTKSENNNSLSSIAQNAVLQLIKKSGTWIITENLSYSKQSVFNRNYMSSLIDGKASEYDKQQKSLNKAGAMTIGLKYNKRINKKNSFGIHSDLKYNSTWGDGRRWDDSPLSIDRENLSDTLKRSSFSPSLSAIWFYKINEQTRLNISSNNSLNVLNNKDIWRDGDSFLLLANNSKDYQERRYDNGLNAQLSFGDSYAEGLSANVSAKLNNSFIQREEHLSNVEDYSKNYLKLLLDIDLRFNKGVNNIVFNYMEKADYPQAIDLRPVIDDSDPFFLKAGNPDLELPVSHWATVKWTISFPKINSILTAGASANLTTDPIIYKTTYNPSETFIPEYNYTAPAGSSLMHSVNVDYKYDAEAYLSLNNYFRSLSSDISFSAHTSSNPFFTMEEYQVNEDKNLGFNCSLYYSPNFIDLSLQASFNDGCLSNKNQRIYDYQSYSISGSVSKMIGSRFRLKADAKRTVSSSSDREVGYQYFKLNAEASLFLGPDNCFQIRVFADDICNVKTDYETIISELYVGKKLQSYLGSFVGISISYTFNKR
ncbi:MAG: hypothetical protein ACI3ZF_06630 [Candidatus Cryptobacteroides sp.]